MEGTDYYLTMEIGRSASGEEIKHAYRRLARRFHPDVSDDPDGEGKFKVLAEAYQTLKRPDLRAAYDGRTPLAWGNDDPRVAYAAWYAWSALFFHPGWLRFWGSRRVGPYREI